MSADNGITIDRKTLKAYHWQGDGIQEGDEPIATGKDIQEVILNVQKWVAKQEKDCGYFEIEYGISFINIH